jgi:hypothetical protein
VDKCYQKVVWRLAKGVSILGQLVDKRFPFLRANFGRMNFRKCLKVMTGVGSEIKGENFSAILLNFNSSLLARLLCVNILKRTLFFIETGNPIYPKNLQSWLLSWFLILGSFIFYKGRAIYIWVDGFCPALQS